MVKVIDCGNTVKVTSCTIPLDGQKVKRLDKDHYEILATGEVLEYEHNETKAGTLQSVRRAFGRLRDLVNSNYTAPENVVLLTLTYAENMKEHERISEDMRHFWRRLKRYSFDRLGKLPHFEYIYVRETQGRGAWHMHCILFFDIKAPRLPRRSVNDVWGMGYTDWVNFKGDINNLGQYLSARLVNHGSWDKKGLRILNYPAGMHIYERSKGIKDPVFYEMPLEEAERFIQERKGVLRSGITDSIMIDCDKTVEYSRYLYTVNHSNGCAVDNARYVKWLRTSY